MTYWDTSGHHSGKHSKDKEIIQLLESCPELCSKLLQVLPSGLESSGSWQKESHSCSSQALFPEEVAWLLPIWCKSTNKQMATTTKALQKSDIVAGSGDFCEDNSGFTIDLSMTIFFFSLMLRICCTETSLQVQVLKV